MQRVKVEVEPTRSAALATAMLSSKTTPQAASGCGIRHQNFCAQASSLRHQITWLTLQEYCEVTFLANLQLLTWEDIEFSLSCSP